MISTCSFHCPGIEPDRMPPDSFKAELRNTIRKQLG
jgi:hypothetical protein